MIRLSRIDACVVCNVPYGKQDIERTESLYKPDHLSVTIR